MFKHYLITATRLILRQKLYSFINLMGLALGLSCSTVILIITISEVRFNNFHEKADNIYLVQQTMDTGDRDYTTDRSGGAYGPTLKDGFAAIEEFVRLGTPGELLLSIPGPDQKLSKDGESEKKFLETTGLAADPSLFKVFSFPLLSGDPGKVLNQPYTIVLTKEYASKYFDTVDPIGKIIRINNQYDFTVTGLIENVPHNSSHQFDFILPFEFLEELGYPSDWFTGNPYYTYLFLNDNAPIEEISSQLPDFFKSFFDADTELNQFLTPLKQVYLYGESKAMAGIIISSLLAVLILLIACINFMNLSTARYLYRTKEVGIRKLAGATRWHLIKQFYGETLLMIFIALNISMLMSDLILDWINRRLSSDITLNLSDPLLIVELIAILLFSALVAGSYPALFLSKFRPLEVLRNLFATGKKGSKIRQALVVTQFTFSVILIISTWYVFKQYDHVTNADLGIQREDIIFLSTKGELEENYNLFKENLLTNPNITEVTSASKIPVFIDQGEFEWGEESEANNTLARVCWVSYDYLELFNIPIAEGRFYSESLETDREESIVINQSLVKMLGWDSAVGRTFYLYDDRYTVIGVIEDFSSFPLTLGGEGLILPFQEASEYIFIKTLPGKTSEVIQFIEKTHDKFNGAYPFIYEIFEDYLDPIYQNMTTVTPTILGFTILGIFISCLGLFGLSIYTAERRTKEIGIRKAMGSSAMSIVKMLAYENIRLILIAIIISFPLSYLLLSMIMKNLSYKTEMDAGIFLGTGGVVMAVVIITIGFQTYRSAVRNPAESLRYE